MILQLNFINTPFARQFGDTQYLHYGPGMPNDKQIIDFIAYHYGFDEQAVTLVKDPYGDVLYCLYGKGVATVWPVFCSYDKDKKIIDEAFLPLNDSTSMYLQMRTSV